MGSALTLADELIGITAAFTAGRPLIARLGRTLVVGMGACFASICDVAIGDIAGPEAGSASGSLSAVQQLASAIGSAVVTTVYFTQLARSDASHAVTVSAAVVGGITTLGLAAVWVRPRRAPAQEW